MRSGSGVSWVVAVLALSWSAVALAEEGSEAGKERAAEVYSTFCASCHGRYGRGDGPLAPSLTARPPDFTDSAWLAGRSGDQIAMALAGASHGPMAVATVLEQDVLRDAIAYIVTLSVPGKHVSLLAGRDIYAALCWVCHGERGDGKGPAAKNLTGAPPRDFTSAEFVIDGREEQIADTISHGAAASFHGSPLMLPWGSHLSPQQIRDVVEYLRTLKTR